MQPKKHTIVNFSTRFCALVEQSGISQKELAASLGISEGAVVNYKKGRIPKAEELLAISAFFGVTMEHLLTGQGSSPAPVAERGNLREMKAETQKLLRQLEAVEETAARLRHFLG